MQKIGVIAASAIAMGADAYRMQSMNNSPFVGEHANADIIERENGSTHRAQPIADSGNKYGSIVSKINKEPYKTPATRLYEKVFGEPEEKSQRKSVSKRLGASQAVVTNSKDDLFTAAFYMGGKQQMNAIIDTATDLVAVEGFPCDNCNGDVYDISGNIDSGKATLEPTDVVEQYGEAYLWGKYANDEFCFQLGKCFNLDFLYMNAQSALDPDVDAILGFSRYHQYSFLLGGDGGKVGHANLNTTFLSELTNNGNDESVFATRFQREYISWVDIG